MVASGCAVLTTRRERRESATPWMKPARSPGDVQVQGVLSSAAERWPHIAISDSLVMADTAVRMVEGGCK